jgi:hypothetical protein
LDPNEVDKKIREALAERRAREALEGVRRTSQTDAIDKQVEAVNGILDPAIVITSSGVATQERLLRWAGHTERLLAEKVSAQEARKFSDRARGIQAAQHYQLAAAACRDFLLVLRQDLIDNGGH